MMRRGVLIAIPLALALCASARGARGDRAPVQVETRLGVDSVTVGERFVVTYAFTYPDSLKMLPVKAPKLDKSRVVSFDWSESAADGSVERIGRMAVMTLDLDGAVIPALRCGFVTASGDTAHAVTDPLTVPVRSIAADSSSLSPLKEPWEAPANRTAWIIAAAAAVVLAALAWWLWRRRRRRPQPEEAAPQLPADYVALTELTRIEKMGLVDAGEFKTHYTLVVDVVRRYLEARFGVDAMDRTTSELLDDVAARGIDGAMIEPLLTEADLVKFAKHTPSRDDGNAALRTAREIVVKTAPRPAAAPAEPKEGAGVTR